MVDPTAVLIVAGLGYGAYRLVRSASLGHRYSIARAAGRARSIAWRQQLDAARRQRSQQLVALRQVNQQMQLALVQLQSAPDFRRAAAAAAAASAVPVGFRQRQFSRFRPQLVRHFAGRLVGGESPDVLIASLTALLSALGIATFEADYIRAEAERCGSPARLPRQATFQEQLDSHRRVHAERMASLRELAGVDEEVREQLVEAEETRFRDVVLQLGGGPPQS